MIIFDSCRNKSSTKGFQKIKATVNNENLIYASRGIIWHAEVQDKPCSGCTVCCGCCRPIFYLVIDLSRCNIILPPPAQIPIGFNNGQPQNYYPAPPIPMMPPQNPYANFGQPAQNDLPPPYEQVTETKENTNEKQEETKENANEKQQNNLNTTNLCRNCGTPRAFANTKFCTNCGNQFSN